jgi:hypothetical protein
LPSPKPRSFVDEASEPRQVIEPDLSGDLQQHKGRWVAIFGGAIVAVGDSAAEVVSEALRKGVTDPTVLRVPLHPDRLAYYRRA